MAQKGLFPVIYFTIFIGKTFVPIAGVILFAFRIMKSDL